MKNMQIFDVIINIEINQNFKKIHRDKFTLPFMFKFCFITKLFHFLQRNMINGHLAGVFK